MRLGRTLTLIAAPVCLLLSGPRPAEAQFSSRAPSWPARARWGARSKGVPCRSPPTATRPSSAGPLTTAASARCGCGREAAASGRSRAPSWSARARRGREQGYSVSLSADGNTALVGGHARQQRRRRGVGVDAERWRLDPAGTQAGRHRAPSGTAVNKASVSLSADGNTAIVGADVRTTVTRGGVGLDAERRRLDPAGHQAGRHGRRGSAHKAFRCRSPPTATRPSSAGQVTTTPPAPRGCGRGAAASGPSREPSWSALARWGALQGYSVCALGRRQHRPRRRARGQQSRRRGVGVDAERRRLDPAGRQAGRHGCGGERAARLFRCRSPADGNTAIVGGRERQR